MSSSCLPRCACLNRAVDAHEQASPWLNGRDTFGKTRSGLCLQIMMHDPPRLCVGLSFVVSSWEKVWFSATSQVSQACRRPIQQSLGKFCVRPGHVPVCDIAQNVAHGAKRRKSGSCCDGGVFGVWCCRVDEALSSPEEEPPELSKQHHWFAKHIKRWTRYLPQHRKHYE